jgi:hypothetical protein
MGSVSAVATARLRRTAYEDIQGYCRSVKLEEIAQHGHVLTPGRYVGAEEVEDDDEAFAEKMLAGNTRWRGGADSMPQAERDSGKALARAPARLAARTP